MKRILFGVFFVVAIAALLFLLLGRDESEKTPAARLASPDSVLYLELRDVPGIHETVAGDDLSKICLEPTVARFFSRPIGQIPPLGKRLVCTGAIAAIKTSICVVSDWSGKDWVSAPGAQVTCATGKRNDDRVHELSGYRLAVISSESATSCQSVSQSGKLMFAVRSGSGLLSVFTP